MDASGASDLHRMALIKGKCGSRCVIVGRHMDVSGALDLHRTVATQRDFSASMGDVWMHHDGHIENRMLEMLSHDRATMGVVHGLTSTRRSRSDGGMRLDREIVVHDRRAIVVHDHRVIVARNRPSLDQTALIFRGNSSLKTDVLLFFP